MPAAIDNRYYHSWGKAPAPSEDDGVDNGALVEPSTSKTAEESISTNNTHSSKPGNAAAPPSNKNRWRKPKTKRSIMSSVLSDDDDYDAATQITTRTSRSRAGPFNKLLSNVIRGCEAQIESATPKLIPDAQCGNLRHGDFDLGALDDLAEGVYRGMHMMQGKKIANGKGTTTTTTKRALAAAAAAAAAPPKQHIKPVDDIAISTDDDDNTVLSGLTDIGFPRGGSTVGNESMGRDLTLTRPGDRPGGVYASPSMTTATSNVTGMASTGYDMTTSPSYATGFTGDTPLPPPRGVTHNGVLQAIGEDVERSGDDDATLNTLSRTGTFGTNFSISTMGTLNTLDDSSGESRATSAAFDGDASAQLPSNMRKKKKKALADGSTIRTMAAIGIITSIVAKETARKKSNQYSIQSGNNSEKISLTKNPINTTKSNNTSVGCDRRSNVGTNSSIEVVFGKEPGTIPATAVDLDDDDCIDMDESPLVLDKKREMEGNMEGNMEENNVGLGIRQVATDLSDAAACISTTKRPSAAAMQKYKTPMRAPTFEDVGEEIELGHEPGLRFAPNSFGAEAGPSSTGEQADEQSVALSHQRSISFEVSSIMTVSNSKTAMIQAKSNAAKSGVIRTDFDDGEGEEINHAAFAKVMTNDRIADLLNDIYGEAPFARAAELINRYHGKEEMLVEVLKEMKDKKEVVTTEKSLGGFFRKNKKGKDSLSSSYTKRGNDGAKAMKKKKKKTTRVFFFSSKKHEAKIRSGKGNKVQVSASSSHPSVATSSDSTEVLNVTAETTDAELEAFMTCSG